MSRCLDLFKKERPPVLAVLNTKEKYIGVIARKWIINSRLDPSTTKVKSLMQSAPKVTPDFPLAKTARLMIESGIRQLPVFRGKTLLGFVTDEDIIQDAVTQDWKNIRIEEIMTKNPRTVDANSSVGTVLSILREHGVSHLPVIEKGRIVGIVSVLDIVEKVFQPRQRQTRGEIVGEKVPVLNIPVKGIMTHPVVVVLPETILRIAHEKMHKFNVSSLVVVSKRRLEGIATKLDFLEAISQIEIQQESLRIQFSVKDLELNPSQLEVIYKDFDSFVHKYKRTLQSGILFVYIKTHGGKYKGAKLIHCRLQLKTVKGAFFSSGEGWGVEGTFKMALDRLENRILRSKELEYEPKHTEDYLEKIGFPLE